MVVTVEIDAGTGKRETRYDSHEYVIIKYTIV